MAIENHPSMGKSDWRLGEHKRTLRMRKLPGKVILGATIFCLIIFVAEIITAVNAYNSPPAIFDSTGSFRQNKIQTALILGGIFFVLTLVNGFNYYSGVKARVEYYENGLVVSDWRGKAVFFWPELAKAEVEPVYARRKGYTATAGRRPINYYFTLTRRDGMKKNIGGLKHPDILENILRREAPSAFSGGGAAPSQPGSTLQKAAGSAPAAGRADSALPAVKVAYVMVFTPEKLSTQDLYDGVRNASEWLKEHNDRFNAIANEQMHSKTQNFAINPQYAGPMIHTPQAMQMQFFSWLKKNAGITPTSENFFAMGMANTRSKDNFFLFYFDMER